METCLIVDVAISSTFINARNVDKTFFLMVDHVESKLCWLKVEPRKT